MEHDQPNTRRHGYVRCSLVYPRVLPSVALCGTFVHATLITAISLLSPARDTVNHNYLW